MGLPGFLKAFVLVCLLALVCESVEPEKVDIQTLARIIQFFDTNFKKVKKIDNKEIACQYAVAINVPKEQCQEKFAPDQSNFLKNENIDNVKNLIWNGKVALYEGRELIAAGVRQEKTHKCHSESILMNRRSPDKPSPMEKLLNNEKDRCVVFYTYNSPCVRTCINETSQYNILKMLDIWSKHRGLKAFVFKDIFHTDDNADLKQKFKAITKYVPLFRCVSPQTCYDCGQGEINQKCVQKLLTGIKKED